MACWIKEEQTKHEPEAFADSVMQLETVGTLPQNQALSSYNCLQIVAVSQFSDMAEPVF